MEEMTVDYKLELVLIPVTDADRAKRFYVEQMGFDLLVDGPNGLPGQRIVQVNPPGSACSIGFGVGVTPAEPGSQQGLHLVVPDIVAACGELTSRGVEVGEVRHIADGAWRSSPDPDRADYMSFAEFTDPDGNLWLLQEVRRAPQGQGDDL
jgi:catechol 2,3-dioxygenase-like lactoylglutathione lyase family enzyme